MKIIKYIAPAVFSLVFLAGCASGPPWVGTPTAATVNNPAFSATLSPVCTGYGCQSFHLTIKNETSQNIELDWNKTLYVTAGQTSGGFMFDGVVYKDRNNPKPPDVIFANSSLQKDIFPNNLVGFSDIKGIGWYNKAMPQGENGAYLTIVVDGKETHAKILVNLSPAQSTR